MHSVLPVNSFIRMPGLLAPLGRVFSISAPPSAFFSPLIERTHGCVAADVSFFGGGGGGGEEGVRRGKFAVWQEKTECFGKMNDEGILAMI